MNKILFLLLLFCAPAFADYPSPIMLWVPYLPAAQTSNIEVYYTGATGVVWWRFNLQYWPGGPIEFHCLKITPTSYAPPNVPNNTWVPFTALIWGNSAYPPMAQTDVNWCKQ